MTLIGLIGLIVGTYCLLTEECADTRELAALVIWASAACVVVGLF